MEHSRISTTAPSTLAAWLAGRRTLAGRPRTAPGGLAFLQQSRGQQRANELRHRGRTDARQAHQFGPRQPAVGLHRFQDPPLVHPPQEVWADLRLRVGRAAGRVTRLVDLHDFDDCTTLQRVFPDRRFAGAGRRPVAASPNYRILSETRPYTGVRIMNLHDPKYKSFALVREMLETPRLDRAVSTSGRPRKPPPRSARAGSCSSRARVPAAFFRRRT